MLLKFFGSRKTSPPGDVHVSLNPNPKRDVVEEKPLILQIIHAGGVVERYYMAFPAARIMEKYPNFVLARPEIFQRPWDSVVRAEEILVPGQKYFVVPTRTVKKLCRRTQKPSDDLLVSKSFVDASNDLVDKDAGDSSSSKSLLLRKPKPHNRHVRFVGVESKTRSDSTAKKGVGGINGKKKRVTKRRVHFSEEWQPSLTKVDE